MKKKILTKKHLNDTWFILIFGLYFLGVCLCGILGYYAVVDFQTTGTIESSLPMLISMVIVIILVPIIAKVISKKTDTTDIIIQQVTVVEKGEHPLTALQEASPRSQMIAHHYLRFDKQLTYKQTECYPQIETDFCFYVLQSVWKKINVGDSCYVVCVKANKMKNIEIYSCSTWELADELKTFIQ